MYIGFYYKVNMKEKESMDYKDIIVSKPTVLNTFPNSIAKGKPT